MPKKKKWTIIFLVSAENDLIFESLSAINEIYSVGCGDEDDVYFVVLFDGVEANRFSKSFALPSIYLAKKNISFVTDTPFINPKPHDDLSDPKVLGRLLADIKQQFPADKYGLFYKGHGGPGETDITNGKFVEKLKEVPSRWTDSRIEKEFSGETGFQGQLTFFGFSRNNRNNKLVLLLFTRRNKNVLTYQKLANVLGSVFRKKLAFICLDCCWGQQIENAYTFSSVTDNFIASADEMPALGLGYEHICKQIVQRTNITPLEISKMLVAVYYYKNYADYDGPNPEFRKMGVSLTHVNTSKKFIDDFSTKFTLLVDYLDKYLHKFFFTIKKARSVCRDYTYQNTDDKQPEAIIYPMFNIDLPWFLENLMFFNGNSDDNLRSLISDALFSLQNRLIHGYLGNNYLDTVIGKPALAGKGITITFPKNALHAKLSLVRKNITPEKDLLFYQITGWKKFLHHYYQLETLAKTDPARFAARIKDSDQRYISQLCEGNGWTTTADLKTRIEKESAQVVRGIKPSKWSKIKKCKKKPRKKVVSRLR